MKVDVSAIITLDWVNARCVDVDGCLVWKRAAAHGDDPQARVGGRDGELILVRRVLWSLAHEKPFPSKMVANCRCETHLCVHPDHIIAVPKNTSQKGRGLPLAHRAKIAAARRANSHLSDEAVAEIRASDWTPQALALRYDIHPSYVTYLQEGKARRDYSNPFQQLGGF